MSDEILTVENLKKHFVVDRKGVIDRQSVTVVQPADSTPGKKGSDPFMC